MRPLLEVDHVKIAFESDKEEVISVEEVSFSVGQGETIGIVGESGCGKSVTSLSIMGLLGKNGKVKNGHIFFGDEDLTKVTAQRLREIRGNEISMIFQEPMTSLNPVFSIGNQMIEGIKLHLKMNTKDAKEYAIEMLKKVGIPRAGEMLKEYPHAFSGGMRQRVMIAIALACKPKLLIADEPTTALDVTIQAQILQLMKNLQKDSETAIILITHDLGVIAETADRVIVMYAGQVVEEADVYTLFKEPKHPYTQGLMASIPHLEYENEQRLVSIPGSVPSLKHMPKGCRFHSRCPHATQRCQQEQPVLKQIQEGHKVRCWLTENDQSRMFSGKPKEELVK
ncbi:oligopeptide/dipeptide ABC transporter ATPase [Neobacillus bataviensis LMG 21833]|uniref:Oligopeptide/dipeptide ABC transporter ATPase n=1 Tax=Neobacillus bataviensis LMG 21833 TaxID=1117379 RepID=K6D563_9BACI|nr:ABC transporter ATP-binding protein [Neobacillus bataviensis]EKN67637.1 oligopeptide/dipeptide ABC transporter ATPase [Neobacillus bataviensis LMG 21833]